MRGQASGGFHLDNSGVRQINTPSGVSGGFGGRGTTIKPPQVIDLCRQRVHQKPAGQRICLYCIRRQNCDLYVVLFS
jgi:hypothetical protein